MHDIDASGHLLCSLQRQPARQILVASKPDLRRRQRMMRKAALFVTAIMLVGSPTAQSEPSYRMADLVPNIERLLLSKAVDAYFVIAIADSPDFVQLYGSDGTAFLNFPLFTERQKSLRSEVVRMCREFDLELTVNQMPGGQENLDCALPRSAGEIGVIIKKFLERMYSVDEETALILEANGFDLTAA